MFNNDTAVGKRMNTLLTVLGVVLIAFLAVHTLMPLKWKGHMGAGLLDSTITVSGNGEVIAIPDIATVSFSVVENAKTVAEAQIMSTKKMETVLASLKNLGIEDTDIKTTDYTAYPRYEYYSQSCTQFSCPPGKQTLTGYEVRQTIMVKIRKIDDAGKVLGEVGEAGVSDISGINFMVDNEDEKIREARQMAIEDARSQAKELAKDLGVRLGDIVSFNESGVGYPMPVYYAKDMAMGMGGSGESSPQLPTGENKIVSNVTITYKIK